MIDMILLTFVVSVFYGGFYLGTKFKTLGEVFAAFKKRFL